MKHVMLVGRWQPVHKGHETLVRAAIDKYGAPALIYVRDIEPDEKNPFTTEQTMEMLLEAFKSDPVKVISGPDICAIAYGRKVGYLVEEFELSEEVQRISATEVRRSIKAGMNGWRDFVSPGVAEKLLEIDW